MDLSCRSLKHLTCATLALLAFALVASAAPVSQAARRAPPSASATTSVSADFPAGLETLFQERARCVVSVELFIQHEVEREPVVAVGLVIDDEGRVIVLDNAIPAWIPPSQFRDLKIHPLGSEDDGYSATYLGQDDVMGWHFLQAAPEARSRLVPISRFGSVRPRMGDPLFGIGVMGKSFDFLPYLLTSRLSLMQDLPWPVGFAQSELATPGAPVFSADGRFAGWAGTPLTQERMLFMGGERYVVGLQSAQESSAFLSAETVLQYKNRIPKQVTGSPHPWMGVAGLQPLDRDVANFLGLQKQGAIVVSDIIEGSPAEKAGLKSRDILVGLDGTPFPKFRPDFVVLKHVDVLLGQRSVGETVRLNIVRGEARLEIPVQLGDSPKGLREAERRYFPRLGLSVREFLLFDAIGRRVIRLGYEEGVIAQFVKPNSPVNAADLQAGDWIKEIDGQSVSGYKQAVELLQKIEEDKGRRDLVLLISRNNETRVLRVKLD